MLVKVLNISERSQIGPTGQITQVLVVRYMVGSTGPFTLITSSADIGSGAALQQMQAFAAQLGTLPIANNQ
jgi:hypothetical protein